MRNQETASMQDQETASMQNMEKKLGQVDIKLRQPQNGGKIKEQ